MYTCGVAGIMQLVLPGFGLWHFLNLFSVGVLFCFGSGLAKLLAPDVCGEMFSVRSPVTLCAGDSLLRRAELGLHSRSAQVINDWIGNVDISKIAAQEKCQRPDSYCIANW